MSLNVFLALNCKSLREPVWICDIQKSIYKNLLTLWRHSCGKIVCHSVSGAIPSGNILAWRAVQTMFYWLVHQEPDSLQKHCTLEANQSLQHCTAWKQFLLLQWVSQMQTIVSEPIILSLFWPLLRHASFFWGSWGSSKNWLELKIESSSSNLACLNRWNTLYYFINK
jgi:hypothetical protein